MTFTNGPQCTAAQQLRDTFCALRMAHAYTRVWVLRILVKSMDTLRVF